ncbi:class I SAM-dependent methyltransferase [Pseudomonas protegens]|uniref:class I SAM-dependent methyltransferase n=1 Tax=Pseudomonas protegens TaxID=380021 RepID=UPI0038094915
MQSEKSVMIHSMFRTGSTYIFNVFRRSKSGFWCYQEPLNEALADLSPDAMWRQQGMGEARTSINRHPELDRPYFWEFSHCPDVVESLYKKEFEFNRFFLEAEADEPDLLRYIKALATAACGRPVYQFCRSVGRMGWFRRQFDATHLYLWRNPWDQWWSYKVDSYFDNTLLSVYSSKNLPIFFKNLKEHSGLIKLKCPDDLEGVYDYENDVPLISDSQLSYFLFYGLWVYGLVSSRECVDEYINIDSLSQSPEYRQRLIERLAEHGLSGIEFNDARVAQIGYEERDRDFFTPIENRVHQVLMCSGYAQEDIDWLLEQRKAHEPNIPVASAGQQVIALRHLYLRSGESVSELKRKQAAVLNKVTDLEQKVADLEMQLQREEKKAVSAERDRSELEGQLIHSRYEFEKVLKSTSWRITAPLRYLRNADFRFMQDGQGKLPDAGGMKLEGGRPMFSPLNISCSPECSNILNSSIEHRRKAFLEWLEENTQTQYDLDHKLRFWETYLRLDEFLSPTTKIVELGGESKITNYLKGELGLSVDVYGQDLRYEFDVESSVYDLVLCLEVIEHIKDRTETQGINEVAMFTRSGVRNVFAESSRVLKREGLLFMTTPNACGVDSIAKLFLYQSPQIYAPHVKEYAAQELQQHAEEHAFELVAFSTANVWNPHPAIERSKVMDILREHEIPTDHRGDDMFLVFRKK